MFNIKVSALIILLILAVFLGGCGGAGPAPTGEGVDYMWIESSTLIPIPAYKWVFDQAGQGKIEFSCWIWGSYWVNPNMIQGQFFLARGVKASSAFCSGVIDGG